MANWNLEAIFGLGDEAEPIAPRAPRQAPPEVKSFICAVRHPSGAPGDLGETVDCHYIITGGVLWLCDERGTPGEKSFNLAPGDDPRRVASRLRRAAWQSERSPFDRPLHYLPSGFA